MKLYLEDEYMYSELQKEVIALGILRDVDVQIIKNPYLERHQMEAMYACIKSNNDIELLLDAGLLQRSLVYTKCITEIYTKKLDITEIMSDGKFVYYTDSEILIVMEYLINHIPLSVLSKDTLDNTSMLYLDSFKYRKYGIDLSSVKPAKINKLKAKLNNIQNKFRLYLDRIFTEEWKREYLSRNQY